MIYLDYIYTQIIDNMNDSKKEKVTGIIDKIIFHNQDNGYYILSVSLPNDEDVTITASHPSLHEGVTYEFEGGWIEHARFGKQMNSKAVYEVPPNTKEGLKAYLASSFFPGIGPVIANRIIKHFKNDDVIRVFNEDIELLLDVPGVSKKKLEAIKESWEANNEINEIMMFLQQFGITTVYAAKIYKHYGKGCVAQIKERPYEIARDIKGIGFKYADKIALEVGVEPDSEERIKACIMHILESGSLDGHCYLLREQITIKSTELLGVDIRPQVENILKYMIQEKDILTIYLDDEENETRYYSKKLYYNEKKCANRIGELLLNHKNIEISETIIETGKLSNEQKESVFGVISKGVSILTGGPGCGKTYTTKTIVEVLLKLGKNLAVCAPTGKAALRSTSVIGFEASTIHRLLGWDPESFGFMHNENNPLPFDFIITEEASMIDINLMSSFLKAIPDECQILFVGDHNQLPPVNAGAPFRDMIESEIVPTFKLTEIFRQAKNSEIITSAHDINNGIMPVIKNPLINPEIWKDGTDCMFIDSGVGEYGRPNSEYPERSSLRYGMDVVDMIKNIYTKTIKKYYNTDDIQILIPMKVSDLGTIKINSIIQETINPLKRGDEEIKIGDKKFRKNDKVIHIQNNYDLEVFNGEIGKIILIDSISGFCEVEFDGGKIIKYKKSNMIELELSFAVSIHKYQGSECSCIILPIMPTYNRMLERTLIYTGITRAKKLCIFIGKRESLQKAVNTVNSSKRQTSLKELLIESDMVNSLIP